MIEVNGKVYRNLQEQVYENTIDIDELKRMYGYRGPYESTDDIENPVDLGLYLIGTSAPYAIYQYHEVTQNYTDLGLFNQRGPQGTPGQTGPQGPQGPEGEKGDPTTISVNGTTYESYMGNITLPDYPDTMAWANITGRPTKLSDFTNDKGFIDNGVDDLVNYYDKTTIDDKVHDLNETIDDDVHALEEEIATKANITDLDDYTKTVDLATVALTGEYDDLLNKPIFEVEITKDAEDNYVLSNPEAVYNLCKCVYYNGHYYFLEQYSEGTQDDVTRRILFYTRVTELTIDSVLFKPTWEEFSFNINSDYTVNSINYHTEELVDLTSNQTITGNKTFKTSASQSVYKETYFDINGIHNRHFADNNNTYVSLTANDPIIAPDAYDLTKEYVASSSDTQQIPNFKLRLVGSKSGETTLAKTYVFDATKEGTVAVMSDIPEISGFVTDEELATALEDYELKTDAFSGNYNDLTNKPDLTVYAETADLGDCAYLDEDELSIAYSQITGTPTIPTKTSDLTNDSGYITGVTWNDVTGKPTFATVATTGSYNDLLNKPTLFSGNYNDLTNKPDLSVYELKSEAFSGDYDDLANKPTIPDAVSGTNDGTNWTSLTIGNNTYGLASGGSSYTAGTGIDITNDVISVDNTVAMKTDVPTATSDLTNDSGFITSASLTNYVKFKTVSDNTLIDAGNYYGPGYEPGLTSYNFITRTQNTFKLPISKSGTIALTSDIPSVPTKTSDLTNDSGFITSNALTGYATETWVGNQGYITGITSSDVTTALGYTPGTSNFSGDYDDLTDKPDLTVYELKSEAFSGDYNDLTNKPDLSIYAQSANLATVATTGSYNDLSNKPTIPTVVDTVADGNMNAVTSNAVYDIVGDIETLLAAL